MPHIWIFAHAWWDHQDLRGLERPHVNQCREGRSRNPWQGMDSNISLTGFFCWNFLSLLPIAVILANHLPDFWTSSTFLKKRRMLKIFTCWYFATSRHCLKLRWHQWPQHQRWSRVFDSQSQRQNLESPYLQHHLHLQIHLGKNLLLDVSHLTSKVFFGASKFKPFGWISSRLTKQSLNLVLIPDGEPHGVSHGWTKTLKASCCFHKTGFRNKLVVDKLIIYDFILALFLE